MYDGTPAALSNGIPENIGVPGEVLMVSGDSAETPKAFQSNCDSAEKHNTEAISGYGAKRLLLKALEGP